MGKQAAGRRLFDAKAAFAFRSLCFALGMIALGACTNGGGSGALTPATSPASYPNAQQPSPGLGAPPASQPMPLSTPGGNVATFLGCPIFTAGDWYNANISAAAVDSNSGGYITSLVQAGDTPGFWASTGSFTNVADASTPHLTVHPKVFWHSFPVPYPWLSTYKILPFYDARAMVFDKNQCRLYESYLTTYSGGTLSAYSGANWSLRQAYVPLPPGTPSSYASGLPAFAGMVKWEEYQAGPINHALDWTPNGGSSSQYGFVAPASNSSGLPFTGPVGPEIPFGAHLRLKSSFNISGFSPEAKAVAQALKTYGMYLADTGSACCGNGLYFSNALDGSNPWNMSDLRALNKIHITDFDVLKLPPLQRVPGH